MSGMKMTVNALQVRFGNMQPEGGGPAFDWAHIHVLESDFRIDEGFAGSDIGKLKLDTDNGNRLAKDLHAAARAGGVLPGFIEVTLAPKMSLGGTTLTVVGWNPVSQTVATSAKAS